MFTNILDVLAHITVVDVLDILLVTFILYSFLRLIKDTRAYQMAIGIVIIGLFYLITKWARLLVSHRLIKTFTTYFIIAVIVLFQGEIRRFLTGLGSRTFRRPFSLRSLEEKLEDLFLAVDYLSQKKIGALIAVEKEISLKVFADRGTRLDGLLSKDLLVNIFFPHSPLHDGAVILQGNKVLAAGCLLPLPASHNLGEEFLARTRHLAALGLSQETDAAVIVVSEETGVISLATKGQLAKVQDKDQLKDALLRYLEQR
jgi:diadenylate cyclase